MTLSKASESNFPLAHQLYVYTEMIRDFITASKNSNSIRPSHSTFVSCETCTCYLRYGRFAIDGVWKLNSLVVASIDVEESARGQGFTRELFVRLQELPDVETLIIECVNEPFLQDALRRWGYSECKISPNCFYKDTSGPSIETI